MWIFGYGSLMFDGWETRKNCIDRRWAELPGYVRSFNKKSIESRGTPEVPGLTLNLTRAQSGGCGGVAFQFADDQNADALLLSLARREACKPRRLPVSLDDGRAVSAWVYIYEGKDLIDEGISLADRAALVVRASGIRGSNFEYVKMIFEGPESVRIGDRAVTDFWNVVKREAAWGKGDSGV